MKLFISLFLLVVFSIQSSYTLAQELQYQISVSATKIQTSERDKFQNLQKAINEFMNNRKWTNYKFSVEEKIECSIFINIDEMPTQTQFKGSIQIQARRPVFNSSYNSVLINHIDKEFEFEYEETQPLEFSDAVFTSNLTAVLAYYSYLILGLDFDSFAPLAGTAFFDKAQAIITQAQNTKYMGWKSFENRKNRYWLVENLLNKSYEGYRSAFYNYHRQGLDLMYDNQETGRQNIAKALETLEKVHNEKPGLIIMSNFFLAKNDEIVNVFSQGNPSLKPQVVKICSLIDPTNAAKYKKITDSK